MYLVVGSTGILGSMITHSLLKAGEKVSALVRDPNSEKAKGLAAAGAKLVKGDLKDAASIQAAVKGIDTVVNTATSTLSRQEGDSIETVDVKGIGNLISAAESGGVKRFVFVSYIRTNVDDSPLAKAKAATEERLKGSKLDYVIVAPTNFIELWTSPAVGFDLAGGKVRIYGDGKGRTSWISVEDVNKAVVAAARNKSVSRTTIQIGGPEAISQLDLVELVQRAAGKKLDLEYFPMEAIQGARAGTPEPIMNSLLALGASTAKGIPVSTEWISKLGVQPVSAKDWISSHIRS